MADLQKIADSVIGGKAADVKSLVSAAVSEGVPVENILKKGLIAGMDVVGTKFRANEFYVPEVLIAARAMHAGLGVLKPILAKSTTAVPAKIVLGTVKGDLHDIGKNLVAMLMEGAGFEVVDLGIDVPSEKFIQAAKETGANVIGMSALLTTTMLQMKATIEMIKSAGLGDGIKTIVGGAPLTAEFARKIGADGYAADAASAVGKVKELLGLS